MVSTDVSFLRNTKNQLAEKDLLLKSIITEIYIKKHYTVKNVNDELNWQTVPIENKLKKRSEVLSEIAHVPLTTILVAGLTMKVMKQFPLVTKLMTRITVMANQLAS